MSVLAAVIRSKYSSPLDTPSDPVIINDSKFLVALTSASVTLWSLVRFVVSIRMGARASRASSASHDATSLSFDRFDNASHASLQYSTTRLEQLPLFCTIRGSVPHS